MFKETVFTKIGKVLFEAKSNEEIYQIAYSFKEQYDKSEKKDKQAGLIAIELAVASYFEGSVLGAALAAFCILDGTGYRGIGLPDLRTLCDVYTEAGAERNPRCARIMGIEYQKGYPPYVIANPYIASYWYKKAADSGDVQAQSVMGSRYFEGIGVEIDYESASLYWEMAARNGDRTAQYNLGCLYDGRLSDGPSPLEFFDPEKAGYWLEKAARSGDKQALEILNRSYKFDSRRNRWERIDC